MKLICYVLATSLLLLSCGEGTTKMAAEENRSIKNENNTINNVKVGAAAAFLAVRQLFKIKSNKSITVKTDKGSRVTIPKDAFVDKETGESVEGDVNVEFIEYETHGEIAASGIPMEYTAPDGTVQQFESAGMFEISAEQNDRELALADGKEIKVELATDVDGNFNFYKLNEDRADWELKDTDCHPVKNNYIDEQEEDLEELVATQPAAPRTPVSYKKGDPLFDVKLDHFGDEIFEQLNGVMWKFSGEDPEKNPTKLKKFNSIYRLVYLEPSDTSILEYNLHFQSLTDTLDIQAVPIFKGVLMDKENDRIKGIFAEINKSIVAQKTLRDELAREKKLLRIFKVDELDVYNYDRQFKDPKTMGFLPELVLADGKSSEGMNFFLIPTEKRVVIKYTPESLENFRINPSEKNKIIAITADNSIYYISNKAIRAMRLQKVTAGSKVKFKMKKYKKKMEKPSDLDELLVTL